MDINYIIRAVLEDNAILLRTRDCLSKRFGGFRLNQIPGI